MLKKYKTLSASLGGMLGETRENVSRSPRSGAICICKLISRCPQLTLHNKNTSYHTVWTNLVSTGMPLSVVIRHSTACAEINHMYRSWPGRNYYNFAEVNKRTFLCCFAAYCLIPGARRILDAGTASKQHKRDFIIILQLKFLLIGAAKAKAPLPGRGNC